MNIKKMLKNKKNIIIVVVVVLVLLGSVLTISFALTNKSNKSVLEKRLKELGKDFYEGFYYEQLKNSQSVNLQEFLLKYSTIGIKVDLDNLSRYKAGNEGILDEFVNKEKNEKCNKDNTKVIIFPEEPFDKTNYHLEVTLDCGFKK